ncbi:MAG: methyl-accepting chemotaxis protein [Candidatus Omnitrophota bacterium]
MKWEFKSISTKFLLGVTAAMVVVVMGLYLFNTHSVRVFGYEKEIERARALTSFCEQVRAFIGILNENKAFNTGPLVEDFLKAKESGQKYDETVLYKTIPVVAAWLTAETKAKELGYIFRVPKNQPRNPKNAPRAGLEQSVVDYLEGRGGLEAIETAGGKIIYPDDKQKAQSLGEIGVLHIGVDRGNAAENNAAIPINAVRFFRSIKLTQDCLLCHGSPKGELDITGGAKEDWAVGETHGAFEIIAPLENLDHQITFMGRIQYLISGGVLILSLLGIFAMLSVTIIKPLNRLKARLQDIAEGEGDLTKQLEAHTKDEIGQVAEWFNRFVSQLRDLMREISHAAEQVSASSGELSSASQSLASSSTQQAANLETTTASVEELVHSIEQNSENAEKTNKISTEAAKEAEKGGAAVIENVEAMKTITQKISIINEIADQTNLLALNAAIEAARAGEMGKGFAVVAVEVRKLAEKSQQAAKEIGALAKDSVEKAEKAGISIREIVPIIQNAAQRMQEIAAACAEQSTGADQIRRAVSEIDIATQQNSATSEETASSSEQLSAQAQMLQSLVARFKVEDSNQSNRRPNTPPSHDFQKDVKLLPPKKESGEWEEEFREF